MKNYDYFCPRMTSPIDPLPMPPRKLKTALSDDPDVVLAYLQRIEAKIDAMAVKFKHQE